MTVLYGSQEVRVFIIALSSAILTGSVVFLFPGSTRILPVMRSWPFHIFPNSQPVQHLNEKSLFESEMWFDVMNSGRTLKTFWRTLLPLLPWRLGSRVFHSVIPSQTTLHHMQKAQKLRFEHILKVRMVWNWDKLYSTHVCYFTVHEVWTAME